MKHITSKASSPRTRGPARSAARWVLAAGLMGPAGAARADDLEVDESSAVELDTDLFGVAETDSSPAPATQNICYARPENWHPKIEAHFRKVFEAAARSTRPPHADVALRYSASMTDPDCAHRLVMTLEPGAKGAPRSLTIQLAGGETVQFATSAGPLVPYRSTADQYEPAWKELWAVVAPKPEPEPEEAEPNPDAADRFVDDDLVEARATLAAQKARDARIGPYLTAFGLAGLTTRAVDTRPAVGRTQDIAPLVSAGARLDLHVGRWVGLRDHRIDAQIDYWHQFASAEVDGAAVETSADRVRAGVEYGRHWFGPSAPEIGLSAGFEYRRFVFGTFAETFSSEVSAVRPGLELAQRLLALGARAELVALAGGRLRVPVAGGSANGEFDLGFDVDGGVRFSHASGFVAELSAQYTRQSASLSTVSFTEDYFDALLGIGWSL